LLSAWNSGELSRLQAVLDQPSLADEGRLTSSEHEKLELIQEIGGAIRMWLRGIRRKNQPDLCASLRLLRHLARCEKVEDDRFGEESMESTAMAETPVLSMQ
jgi:hypothetical protein